MSTVNTEGRTNEQLSAYLSEILENEPIDQHFPEIPALDWFMAKSKSFAPTKQYQFPINAGQPTTGKWFKGSDTFSLTTPDTALTVFYPNVNYGEPIPVLWEEKHESGADATKVFDIVKHRVKNARRTAMDNLAVALWHATGVADSFTPIPVTVDSTGSTGGLSASTTADWLSIEKASGSFALQGQDDMNDAWDQIREFGGMPQATFTTRAAYGFYKKDLNPDLRYVVKDLSNGKRGFSDVSFMDYPVMFDRKVATGEMYFIDPEDLFLAFDNKAKFATLPFQDIVNQPGSSAAYLLVRCALVCLRRRSHGKMTGIVA